MKFASHRNVNISHVIRQAANDQIEILLNGETKRSNTYNKNYIYLGVASYCFF